MTEDQLEFYKRRFDELEAQRQQADERIAEIDAERQGLIQMALYGGLTAIELSELTGLSRARIYQIRDGRR